MFLFTLFGKQLFTVVMEILIIIVDPWLEFLIVAQDIYSAKGKGIWSSLRCQWKWLLQAEKTRTLLPFYNNNNR